MRKIIMILCCCFGVASLAAENKINPVTTDLPPKMIDPKVKVSNELATLDILIDATQRSLDNQKALRDLIKQYQSIQKTYLLHPDDNELLYQLVKVGHLAFENIKQNHLTQDFDPDFLGELSLCSQVAVKHNLPKP